MVHRSIYKVALSVFSFLSSLLEVSLGISGTHFVKLFRYFIFLLPSEHKCDSFSVFGNIVGIK